MGVLLLSCAPFADAAESTAVKKVLCEPGVKSRVVPPTFTESGTKSALLGSVQNVNFCTDERIALGPLGQVQEASTCICVDQPTLESVGCGPSQQQTYITISIKKALTGCISDNVIISKCAKDPKAAYQAACKSGMGAGEGDTDEEDSVTVERTPWTLDDLPTLSVPSETDAMVNALTYAGVSSPEAQRLSTQNPQNAQEYIRALVDRDETAIKATAAKLNINPNLSDNIAMLVPPPERVDTPVAPPRDGERDIMPTSTGFGPDAQRETWTGDFPTQCGIPGQAGLMMRLESGCGKATRNPRADVRGPLQFLCGTWNTYARETGNGQHACQCTSGGYYASECSAVDDPLISSQVVNAQYDRYQTQYGGWCTSINQRWETCAYMIHFAGVGGFGNLVAAYSMNPSTPLDPTNVARLFQSSGAYTANREVFQQAGTVAGLFNLFETKLRGGSVTSTYYTPTGVTTNTGYSLNPNFGGVISNTFGGGGGIPLPSQTPVVMSPFANASLFSGLAAQTQQNAAQYTPQNTTQQQVVPAVTPTTYPKAEVSLKIEPRIGTAGDKFKITWTSSGINQSISCTIALPGSNSANVVPNGSQSVTIKKPNVYAIVFTCKAMDGKPVVAQDTVFVQ